MKMLSYASALPVAVLAAITTSSMRAAGAAPEILASIAIDVNNDGKSDRAILFRSADSGDMDLAIYYSAGSQEIDASRKPDFMKKQLVAAKHPPALETTKRGALVVRLAGAASTPMRAS